MSQSKIAILGTGDVGRALGTGFAAKGHEVRMGSRDAKNPKAVEWASKVGARASVGTFADAAAFGDVVVLCTLWAGTKSALEMAGAANMNGKLLIDTTNPLDFSGGAPKLAVGHTDSAGESVQRWVPGARVVKCFNSVGNALMVDPKLPGGPPDMFIAGNDAAAKATTTEFLTSFGWATIDAGGIEASRYLEALCMLWVGYGAKTGTWSHAFKLLRAG